MFSTSYSHVVPLSKEKCRSMHLNLLYHDPQFPGITVNIVNNKGEFSGTGAGSNKEGKCTGTTFTTHKSNIGVLEDVHVHITINVEINEGTASLNIKNKQLTFESNYHSQFDDLESFEPTNGFTFWQKEPTDDDCKNKKFFVVYEDFVTKTIEKLSNNKTRILYIIHNEEEGREFLLERLSNTSICGEVTYETQSASLYIIESTNGAFNNKMEKNINPRNFDNNLFLSMKISHLSYNTGQQLNELYTDLMYEKCITDRKVALNRYVSISTTTT